MGPNTSFLDADRRKVLNNKPQAPGHTPWLRQR
ncbi:hypothetical protein C4J97_2141 [Pseudomonas orientalis]|nr:hypothetical protein C4J97_2141 [Pseudomonas orientalis]